MILYISVSVCVECTVAIPEPNQSLIPQCCETLGYVRSLVVLDSPINALSDSYPVTLLVKVVALLPPVADSLALSGPVWSTLLSISIGRFANGWQSNWVTTNGRKIWSRYFYPGNVPPRIYKSGLQFREKHSQKVTPPPPNAVVPTICSWRDAVFLSLHMWTRQSTGFNKI